MSRHLAVLLFLGLASHAPCQVQTGRISGVVYDPNRASVPNAAITVTNKETGVAQRVATDGSGSYVVPSLNPGIYDVSASAGGFKTTVRSNVEMQVGRDLLLDLDLALGETTTVVEVTSEIPLLNSESGNLGHVMTNQQIVDLPLNGRGFNELARLTPGVVLLGGTGNVNRVRPEFFNGTTISGVRGRQVSYYLDGADTTEQHQGGSWIQTSIDALQEFSVQQNAYSAEHSRSGSFFNATTKSGTNAVRGTLYEFLRNDKLDSRNFFGLRRDILKRNQFGASIGGPVLLPKVYDGRNRTFFFFNYEGTRERQGNVINRFSPTPGMLAGDFSALGNTLYDPATTGPNPAGSGAVRTPFAGNRIPTSRLSPQAQFFVPYLTTAVTPGGLFTFSPSTGLDLDQYTTRIDHSVNDAHRVFFRWGMNKNGLNEPGNAPALGIADSSTRGQNYTASITSNLKPSLVNELRVNTLYGLISLNPYLLGRDFNKDAGIRGMEETKRSFDVGSFPDFAFAGYAGLSGSTFDQRPKTQDRYTLEFVDNATWIRGKHVVKFGTKIRHYQWLGTDSKNYMGQWTFNGQNTQNPASATRTGDAMADFVLGLPQNGGRGYPSDTFGGDYTASHFFLQDDIKVTERLTLNVGLRYEYTPFASAYRGQTGTFDGTQARPIIVASRTNDIDLGAQPGARRAYSFLGNLIQTSNEAGLPYSITYPDKNQWAPRFGFAWRPIGEATVIRGGYGIFYEGEYTDSRVNLFMPPFLLSDSAVNEQAVVPNRTLADFFLGAPLGSPNSTIGLTPTYTRLQMGNDQHWNFGVQRQLGKQYMFDIEYVGNKGSNIQSNNAFNIPEPGAGGIQARRPYPRYAGFSYIASDTSTTYHALQMKFEKRLSQGLWFLSSYTFAKSLWAANTAAAGGRYRFERGPSEYQVPHTVSNSFGYQLPFGRGQRVAAQAGRLADGLIGGWQLQGILIFRSGVPYTVTMARDVANTGVGGQRPNRLSTGKLDNPTLERWFDTTAFAAAPNFAYGNSGLRILPTDIVRTIDFSMFKNFTISERSKLQFRWEAFNLPNTPSFAAPNSTLDTGTVGRITATSTAPRQMQIAVKLTF
ncbi:MAG: carboxypeptidase regulatory-like domain-containing protein [Bryobacterales bacterium]|nr:carboxypeptidase regulatory-like domain-containing protein [Bryobacterales bacterium]